MSNNRMLQTADASVTTKQFELQVDGKTRPSIIFERVTAGGHNEASQLAAARSRSADKAVAPKRAKDAGTPEHGRIIFFFVDDLHLSGTGIGRAREALQRYVDNGMHPKPL